MNPSANSRTFGETSDGTAARLYTLANRRGISVDVCDFGCTIVSIRVPNRHGAVADVALGHKSVGDYERSPHYLGCVVGRYANRIAHGRFELDGAPYELACNNGPHHLHGGNRGWHAYVWRVVESTTGRIRLSHVSVDGDEGFPGRVVATCTYTLSEENELTMQFDAVTDKATVINLTNHSYFNLAGHDSGPISDQVLQLLAERYTPADKSQIPTGEIRKVIGTPYDFTTPKPIGRDLETGDEELQRCHGYDHNFVLSNSAPFRLAAIAHDDASGRFLEVRTTEPGLQLYTANWLEETGKAPYAAHHGFCLETQHFPDSPNQPAFPTTVLRPGERYNSVTSLKFGCHS